jgi:hypothetical protein
VSCHVKCASTCGNNNFKSGWRTDSEILAAAKVLALASPGGAARQLATGLNRLSDIEVANVDFARLFYGKLKIGPNAPQRSQGRIR